MTGDTDIEKGDMKKPKALCYKGFGLVPELFKSCFPHQKPNVEKHSVFCFLDHWVKY